jgi:hypothetical protein
VGEKSPLITYELIGGFGLNCVEVMTLKVTSITPKWLTFKLMGWYKF